MALKKFMYFKSLTRERIDAAELVNQVAGKVKLSPVTVEKVTVQLFETIMQALEECRPVNIKNFGTFFIRPTSPTRQFKFNPSQRLRKILGWSSKYQRVDAFGHV